MNEWSCAVYPLSDLNTWTRTNLLSLYAQEYFNLDFYALVEQTGTEREQGFLEFNSFSSCKQLCAFNDAKSTEKVNGMITRKVLVVVIYFVKANFWSWTL
jgi:hypothetical protein